MAIIRAKGRDISKWDNNYVPTDEDFVIQRLSYCLNDDEKLAAYTAVVMAFRKLANKVVGAYHYYSSGAPWQKQCDHFLALANGQYDFLALDVEEDFNSPSTAFLTGIEPAIHYLIAQSKKPVLLYINPKDWAGWCGTMFNGHHIWEGLLQFDLWVAQYWNIPALHTNPWLASTMRPDWKFWQWKPNPDLNYFNGTVADMQNWLHPVVYKDCPTCVGQGFPAGKVPA